MLQRSILRIRVWSRARRPDAAFWIALTVRLRRDRRGTECVCGDRREGRPSNACRHRDPPFRGARRGPVRTGAVEPKEHAQTTIRRLSRCGRGASPNEPGLNPGQSPGSFGSVRTRAPRERGHGEGHQVSTIGLGSPVTDPTPPEDPRAALDGLTGGRLSA